MPVVSCLRPGTVRVLRADEIFNAALSAGLVRVVERAQTHDGPGGLRGGARSLALEDRVVVGVAAFAPAAVFVLDAFQPVARLEQPGLAACPGPARAGRARPARCRKYNSRPSGRTRSRRLPGRRG